MMASQDFEIEGASTSTWSLAEKQREQPNRSGCSSEKYFFARN
jgi:hypothetical protein